MSAPAQVLDQLHTDHRHIVRLLFTLQAEVDRLKVRDGGPLHLEMVVDALDYLQDYPQQCHHPTEDAAYARLLEKSLSPEQRLAIGRIEEEHGMLEALASDLAGEFGRVAQDAVVPAEILHGKASRYVEALYAHLRAEEKDLFPLMRDLFDESDWAAIGQKLASARDPLFDERRASFDQLYKCILTTESAA